MPDVESKTWHAMFFRGRFLPLLVSILLLIAIAPVFQGMVGVRVLIDVFLACTFVSGVAAVSHRRHLVWVAGLLALPLLLCIWASYFWVWPVLELLRNILGLLFFGVLVVTLTDYIFRGERVSRNLIHGAIVVYLLIGVLWSFVFGLIHHLQPEAFHLNEGPIAESRMLFLYFSFVTLTTLGYGDISPATAQAGALAILEAIVGQIYLTVLVARLVGMHISQQMEKKNVG